MCRVTELKYIYTADSKTSQLFFQVYILLQAQFNQTMIKLSDGVIITAIYLITESYFGTAKTKFMKV